ncbi:MAG: hypothetical protein DHS20C19_02080 [Acidimicrobiales bacterium]|nr:MAG: hypothetical protein DHS20C19_02080 [Acidimicrobiales bacterium]
MDNLGRALAALAAVALLGAGCAAAEPPFVHEGERSVTIVLDDLRAHPCGHHVIPESDGYIWSSVGTLPASWSGVVAGTLSWSGLDGVVTADDGTTLAYLREHAQTECDWG